MGLQPGEVVYADATGVVLLHPGAAPAWLRDGSGGVGVGGPLGGRPMALSILPGADDRLAVLVVARKRAAARSIPMEGRGRLRPLGRRRIGVAWSFARTGGAEGAVIPRGVTLARAVSVSISNLVVEKWAIAIRR